MLLRGPHLAFACFLVLRRESQRQARKLGALAISCVMSRKTVVAFEIGFVLHNNVVDIGVSGYQAVIIRVSGYKGDTF